MIHIESLLSAIVFVVLDGIYLNLVQKYFNNQIKIIQGSDIKINLLYKLKFISNTNCSLN